jgi:hypothetical protein
MSLPNLTLTQWGCVATVVGSGLFGGGYSLYLTATGHSDQAAVVMTGLGAIWASVMAAWKADAAHQEIKKQNDGNEGAKS